MKGLHMKYFILKPSGDDVYAFASRRALLAYAETIETENPELAESLREWKEAEVQKIRRKNDIPSSE